MPSKFDIATAIAATYLLTESIIGDDGTFLSIIRSVVKKGRKPNTNQGESKEWQHFYQLYDDKAQKLINNQFTSISIPTSFGTTHVWLGGNLDAPPALFFHGVRATSLMWDNLVQNDGIQARKKCILIDYITDTGRSLPSRKGPSSEAEHSQWVVEILTHLKIHTPVDMVGYSYGSFVAAMVAKHSPELVRNKSVILISPAAVFSPLATSFYYHALMPFLFNKRFGYTNEWSDQWMSGKLNYNQLVSLKDREFSQAGRVVSIQSDAVVAVIIVRVVFINSFLFYCLLLNHSFQTNPNSITNCFQLFSLVRYLLLIVVLCNHTFQI